MFKASENLNVDGKAIAKLEPAIYVGVVESVNIGVAEDFNTKQEIDTLEILFKDGATGSLHLDVIKDPGMDENRAINLFERLCHIASRVIDEKEITKFLKSEFPDFKALQTAYVKLMKDSNKTQVEFKVLGSTYGGKTSTKMPSFSAKYNIPFIETVESGKKVAFTKSEITENTAYKKLLSVENGTSEAETSTSTAPATTGNAGGLF